MSFGTKLQKLRLSKNMSQQELAEELGIGRSTLANYEQDKREPNFQLVKMISYYFGVSVDYLLDIENENYNFSHCEDLTNSYIRGINIWMNNKLLTIKETKILHEHFTELLLRYKLIINHSVDACMYWHDDKDKITAKYLDIYDNEKDIKRVYFEEYISDDIIDLNNWIKALPYHFSLVEDEKEE